MNKILADSEEVKQGHLQNIKVNRIEANNYINLPNANIYDSNGSISAHRTVTTNDYTLTFAGSNDNILINDGDLTAVNITGTLTESEQPNITSLGAQTQNLNMNSNNIINAGTITSTGITVNGDLDVIGDATYLSTTHLEAKDNIVLFNTGNPNDTTFDQGIIWEVGPDNAFYRGLIYDLTDARFHTASTTTLPNNTLANITDLPFQASILYTGDGTNLLPSITFGTDNDTGIFRKADNNIALTAGGTEGLNITNTIINAMQTLNMNDNDITEIKSINLIETGIGTDEITIRAPISIANPYTLTLPVDAGTNNQVLQTDGSGNLSWGNSSGSIYTADGTLTQNRIIELDGNSLTLSDNNDVVIDDGKITADSLTVASNLFYTNRAYYSLSIGQTSLGTWNGSGARNMINYSLTNTEMEVSNILNRSNEYVAGFVAGKHYMVDFSLDVYCANINGAMSWYCHCHTGTGTDRIYYSALYVSLDNLHINFSGSFLLVPSGVDNFRIQMWKWNNSVSSSYALTVRAVEI